MQVGIITIGGRQVGVIMQGQDSVDTDTPPMPDYDDRGGNSQLGDDVPGSRDPEGNGTIRRRSHSGRSGGSPEHRERRAPTAQSSDGMDAYGDGDGGKSRAKEKYTDTPYGVGKGNPFDRARFARELEEKPWLREKIKHISLGENQDPTANLAVIETMMNRAAVRGTSLEQQAKRHRTSGKDEGGYYAGYAPSYSPSQGALADRSIDKALMGSNVTNYATDNSSGALAAGEKQNGRFVHHKDFNRESFFSPGSAEPAFRSKWQQMRRAVDKYENPDPSVDGIAPPSMGKASDKTSALPAKTRLASSDPKDMPVYREDFGYGMPDYAPSDLPHSSKIDDVGGPATLEDFKDRPDTHSFDNISEREFRGRNNIDRDKLRQLPKEPKPAPSSDEDTPQS